MPKQKLIDYGFNVYSQFLEDGIVLKIFQIIRIKYNLSIDIDGNDYFLLKDLKSKPRVIICEYNPTIPPYMKLVAKKNSNFGCSALALKLLAESKGYTLVSMTESNCIFVLNELVDMFKDFDIEYESIFCRKNLTYVITDYSGNYMFSRQPVYGFKDRLNVKFI